jgi:putative nucleotidyltransferase with HDIG domain
MDEQLTKILTLVAALGLGLFLGKLIFGRKKAALPPPVKPTLRQAQETFKSPLLKPVTPMGLQPLPTARSKSASSVILEEKILYEEEVALLLKIGQEISASLKIDDIVKSIVDNVTRVLNVQICSILMEREKGELQIRYAVGLSEDNVASTSVKKGSGISGRVFITNENIVINDLENDLRFRNSNEEKYYRRSLVSVPVSISGKVLAVLNISNKKTGEPFSSEDIRFIRGLASEAAIALNSARLYEELQQSYIKTITVLASTIDAKDPYTLRHSENVTRVSLAIANAMRLPQADIETLRIASLLHDIGKIGIRDGILSKPGKLTDEEFQEIQKHASKGEEILSVVPFLKKASFIVRHHHEWFDGNGYPDKVREHQIELAARIIGVADSLDAMISDRPYRKALPASEALAELERKSGSQFDPEIVGVFMKVAQAKPEILTR